MKTMTKQYKLGIDIGGTKIALGLVDQAQVLVADSSFPTNIESAESLFQDLLQHLRHFIKIHQLELSQIASIGMGIPGKVDRSQGIALKQNNIPWENFPVSARLKTVFPKIPVSIDNDVNAAAWAEYKYAQLKSTELFEYMTISTGIALTSVLGKKIIRGEGFSGEIGLLRVKGNQTLEEMCSGPGIARQAQILLGKKELTTREVFEGWRAGHTGIDQLINWSADQLARVVHAIICLHDPKRIVFGGSVIYHNQDFFELLKNKLSPLLHPEQEHILNNLGLSVLGSKNGVVGAALLNSE